MVRTSRFLAVAVIVLLSMQVAAAPATAAVSVTRAELSGSRLRIDGTASASRDITVNDVVMARSSTSGTFRIERDPYSPPADCMVHLNDGSATATSARLSGCTVTQTPPPPSADTTAPNPPTGLGAALAGTTANLSWTASTDNVGVTGYRVSRNGAVLPGTPTGTSFSDPNLAAGTYTYTVVAVDAAGNVSGASNGASVTVSPPPADTTPPSVPTEFKVVLRNTDNIDLTWRVSTDDTAVSGYRIMRNGQVLPGLTTTLFYNDTQLAPNTYTYSIAAVDTAGNMSGWTEPMSATVVAPPPPPANDVSAPSAPTNLSATVIGTTVSLGWTMSSDDTGVTGYRVHRNGALLTTLGAPRDGYSDSGLAAGSYTYFVEAFDAAGNTSARSTSVTATVQAEGLYFITPAQMPDATVGQAYLGYIVSSDPTGPSTFRFRLVSGQVPDGTRFSGNTLENRPEARVTGTPTRTGTFSFTVRVQDNTGATATRTFTIRVVAGS